MAIPILCSMNAFTPGEQGLVRLVIDIYVFVWNANMCDAIDHNFLSDTALDSVVNLTLTSVCVGGGGLLAPL